MEVNDQRYASDALTVGKNSRFSLYIRGLGGPQSRSGCGVEENAC
jgi:hypothetical protein